MQPLALLRRGGEFIAEIADEKFLSHVDAGDIRIDLGKPLPVDLRMIQSFEGEREQLHTEYRVMKVHDRFRPFRSIANIA